MGARASVHTSPSPHSDAKLPQPSANEIPGMGDKPGTRQLNGNRGAFSIPVTEVCCRLVHFLPHLPLKDPTQVLNMASVSSLVCACISAFIVFLVSLGSVCAQPREVELQLLWNHQFQFAGF